MYRKNKITAIIAIAVALAFVMPVAAVANFGTIGVTSNSENTGDMKNIVETSTNSDSSDNIETTSDTEKPVIDIEEFETDDGSDVDIEEFETDANSIVSATGKTIYGDDDAYPNWYDETYVKPVIDIEETDISVLIPSTSKTVYVDDDADPDWYDEYHVKTITEGITNASIGDTVYVLNGFYYECVTVNKQLNLVGQSKNNVIVDGSGSGDIFKVTADGVSIDTFTITNGGLGIYLYKVSNNNVTNCDIYNNNQGIYIYRSPDTTLKDNTFYDNACNFDTYGIPVSEFNQDIDSSNTVDGKIICYLVGKNDDEINETMNIGYLGLISCDNITAKNSDVGGIVLAGTTNSKIFNISSHDNTYGVLLRSSSENEFVNCTFYDNNYGIFFRSSGAINNNIINCNVYDNSEHGIYHYLSSNSDITNCNLYNNKNGIYLKSATYTNIVDCTVYNNSEYGIFLYIHSQNSNITNCNAYNNGVGIGSSHGFTADYANIVNCNAYNNSGDGFFIRSTIYDTFTNCNAYNNSGNGFHLYGIQTTYNTFTNCNAYDNSNCGFFMYQSVSNDIIDCNVYNNNYGFFLQYADTNNFEGNTIYDNNVYNFGVDGITVGDFSQDIDDSNTVDEKPILYFVGESNMTLDETSNAGYLGLVSCTNITAKNLDVEGMVLAGTTKSTIFNVNSHNGLDGISIYYSPDNNITDCNAYDNFYYGIRLYESPDNNFTNCNSYGNSNLGFYIENSLHTKLRDTSIYNNAYGFLVKASTTEGFHQNIDATNTVDGKRIYYLMNRENEVLDGTVYAFGFLALISCTNITAKNADTCGILIVDTTDSTISNINSHKSGNGIFVSGCSGINIVDCTIGDNSWCGILFYGSSNCNVINCNAYGSTGSEGDGIRLAACQYIKMTNCNLYNNDMRGIYFYNSKDNDIINCNSYNNHYGIYFRMCMAGNDKIINSSIYDNDYGIELDWGSFGNFIHHNNLANNIRNALDDKCMGSNEWDDGSEGNYWSDYTGEDLDGDGIGDTPYNIPGMGSSKDRFPLMLPIDSIPPLITDVIATPEVEIATEPVNITCTVTDNWGLVDTVKINITGPGGFALETIMSEGSYYYEDTYATLGVYYYYIWANDTNGNIAISDTCFFIIREYGPPTSNVDPLPTWETVVSFIITATAYDETGVADVTLWYQYSADGTEWTDWASYGIDEDEPWSWEFTGNEGYYKFYSIAVDTCSNVEDPPEVADASTGIDITDPVTTHAIDPETPDGENDWYVSSVEVTLSATDELSGIESTWYTLDFGGQWILYTIPFWMIDDGEHTVQYYSFDKAGNKEDTKSVSFKIDKTAPVTTYEFEGFIGEDGWFVTNVTVTLSAEDVASGVASTMYKIDEGEWTTYVEFVVTEDGTYILYYYSVDLAGNREPTHGVTFKIDHDVLPPVTTHDFDGIDGDNDWFISDVTVTLSAVDFSPSGIDYTMYKIDEGEFTEYTGPFYVTEDDVHTLYYYSVDYVGNKEETKQAELKIDQTAPTIILSVQNTGLMKWLLIATVNDETSGVAIVEFYLDGKPLGEVAEPPYTLECSKKGTAQAIVFDNAGNKEVSEEVPVSQSQSSSSTSLPWPFSWLLGLW